MKIFKVKTVGRYIEIFKFINLCNHCFVNHLIFLFLTQIINNMPSNDFVNYCFKTVLHRYIFFIFYFSAITHTSIVWINCNFPTWLLWVKYKCDENVKICASIFWVFDSVIMLMVLIFLIDDLSDLSNLIFINKLNLLNQWPTQYGDLQNSQHVNLYFFIY